VRGYSILINFISELEQWLEFHEINKEDVCLVGSSILAAVNIRENHDLEITLRPIVLNRLCETGIISKKGIKWVTPIGTNLDLFKNQFYDIGITDSKIFDRNLYIQYNGFHVVLLEIEYLYKKSLKRDKDRKDVRLIEAYDPNIKNKIKRLDIRMPFLYKTMRHIVNIFYW
jgi:hypothetical protein